MDVDGVLWANILSRTPIRQQHDAESVVIKYANATANLEQHLSHRPARLLKTIKLKNETIERLHSCRVQREAGEAERQGEHFARNDSDVGMGRDGVFILPSHFADGCVQTISMGEYSNTRLPTHHTYPTPKKLPNTIR